MPTDLLWYMCLGDQGGCYSHYSSASNRVHQGMLCVNPVLSHCTVYFVKSCRHCVPFRDFSRVRDPVSKCELTKFVVVC